MGDFQSDLLWIWVVGLQWGAAACWWRVAGERTGAGWSWWKFCCHWVKWWYIAEPLKLPGKTFVWQCLPDSKYILCFVLVDCHKFLGLQAIWCCCPFVCKVVWCGFHIVKVFIMQAVAVLKVGIELCIFVGTALPELVMSTARRLAVAVHCANITVEALDFAAKRYIRLAWFLGWGCLRYGVPQLQVGVHGCLPGRLIWYRLASSFCESNENGLCCIHLWPGRNMGASVHIRGFYTW